MAVETVEKLAKKKKDKEHRGCDAAVSSMKQEVEELPGLRTTNTRETGAARLFKKLGPGLVTGASDDDPSGIATYSQVGAQFGYGLLWTMLLSYPLMAAIQEICARIGRVTGCGIAANLRKSYSKLLLYSVLVTMSIANVFNLGADIGAMGAGCNCFFQEKSASSP